MKKNGGFTIIEFMIAVAILAIIAAIVIPNLLGNKWHDARKVVEGACKDATIVSTIDLGDGGEILPTQPGGQVSREINLATAGAIAKVCGGGVLVDYKDPSKEDRQIAIVKEGKIVAIGVVPSVSQGILDSIVLVPDKVEPEMSELKEAPFIR
jgi:prepilin-type N-terminal cleavage/methylation domain-containing protein